MTVLEKIGHYLDVENDRLRQIHAPQSGLQRKQITKLIGEQLDVREILRNSAQDFDGGYAFAGLIGHGDAFVLRDPAGIRPCFWYADDEFVVAASERPAIQTAFALKTDQVLELRPGHALIVRKDGILQRGAGARAGREAVLQLRAHLLQPRQRSRRVPRAHRLGRNVVPAILEPWTTTWRTPYSASSPTRPRWPATGC
jgi:hypothetical protein